MPNRILKESICSSDNVDQLTAFQETFFYRLIVNCDDFGRMDARPKILSSRLFPLKEVRSNQIEDALRALTSAELVILYEVDGKPFLQMKTWDKHQQVRAKKSKYPSPDDGERSKLLSDDKTCNQMISDDSKCPRNPIQSESNPNPMCKSEPQKRFTPPTVEQVRDYCRERGNSVDPEKFVDFYTSKGWKVGKDPMKDWKASVRTWEKDSKPQKQESSPAGSYHQRDYSSEQQEAMQRFIRMNGGG